MKPCSLFCLLTLLALPLRATPAGADPPHPAMVLQVGHSRGIGMLAYSPDGKTLATGGDGVRLWDVASGQVKAILQGHTDYVNTVAFAPDGKTLATGVWFCKGCHDPWERGPVELWDVASGQLKATLDGAWTAFAFAPDGKTLATGSEDGNIWLWDVTSAQLKAILRGHEDDWMTAFALSPNGQTLATGSDDATARLWEMATGQLKASLQGHTSYISALAFSPDGKTLATGSWKEAWLWEVATGQLKAILVGHTNTVTALAFSPDGTMLATRDTWGRRLLWEVARGKPIPITRQTPLAQFPPWFAHPVSMVGPAVSLLDPLDEHVLATLQPLPDAVPYAATSLPGTPDVLSDTGGEWIALTPDGYFEGSANVAALIRWNLDGVLYPAATYWETYHRPDLVCQALNGGQSSPP